MGRFARNQSGALLEKAARQPSASARPRFSTDPRMRTRDPQVKSHPPKQEVNAAKPYKPAAARQSNVNRRTRKRIRLVALAVMSLAALGAGWMLGKAVLGPSPAGDWQPAASVQSAGEDKDAAVAPDLEANAAGAQEPEAASQDQKVWQGADVKEEKGRQGRKAVYPNSSRHEFVGANARRGSGIGVVTKPIKTVFKPLKRANPFRLRIW